MTESDFERLREMLGALPPREAETAHVCWDDEYWGDWDDQPLGGVRYAAWAYAKTLPKKVKEGKRRAPKMTPHEVERALSSLAVAALDLRAKIQRVQESPECLRMIEALSGPSALSPLSWTVAERALVGSELHSWFLMRRGRWVEDGSFEEDEPSWGQDGMRAYELEDFAKVMNVLATQAATRKQAPNGPRKGASRPVTVEGMLFLVGRMVRFQNRPWGHILPIARTMHEWVTGEQVGREWGKRPFERIKAYLKTLNLEAEGPGHQDPRKWKPVLVGSTTRIERLKAELLSRRTEGGTPPEF